MTDPATQLHELREFRVAVVTGASGGIGRCVAARLAQRGHTLVLIGRREDALREVMDSLPGNPYHTVIPIDLADPDEIDRVHKLFSGPGLVPEVFIHCAGVARYQPLLEHDAEADATIMAVNYHAAVRFIRAFLPGMIERGSGAIINVASIAANMGPWGHAAYAASKAALVALTQSLAAEHADAGVHFSYVKPGIVRTPLFESEQMQPLWQQVRKHAIEPDAVAKKIVRLLDRPRLELVVPRHYRVLDWINALSPTALHKLVTRNSRPKP